MAIARRGLIALGSAGIAGVLRVGVGHAADKTVILGCSVPLSGPAASIGITTQRTVEHAVELINAKGIQIGEDRYTLVTQFYDNKYVPAEAVTVVEKMLADGVRYLFSSGSGNSVPVVAKTTAAKVLQMSAASGKSHLTAPQFPYSFRVQPTNETAYAVYPWLKTTYPEVKRVAHMNPSDEAGFTESEDRRMIAERNGFTNVGNEYFKRGSTDMYPVATRLVGFNPDLIDFGGTIGRDQGLAVKALRELGYTGRILLGYSDAKSFVDIAGPDAAEGTMLFDTLAEPQTPGTEGTLRLVDQEIRAALPQLRLSDVGLAVHSRRRHAQGAVGRPRRRGGCDAHHDLPRHFRRGEVRHEVGLRSGLLVDAADPDGDHQGRQTGIPGIIEWPEGV